MSNKTHVFFHWRWAWPYLNYYPWRVTCTSRFGTEKSWLHESQTILIGLPFVEIKFLRYRVTR